MKLYTRFPSEVPMRQSDSADWNDGAWCLEDRRRRLCDDQQGTALTEFVITLPVFILLFSAVVWMGQAYSKAVETDIRASFKMWNNATTVQHDRIPSGMMHTMHPTAAGVAGAASSGESAISGGGLSNIASEAYSGLVHAARAAHGTHGESAMYLLPVKNEVGTGEVHVQANEHITHHGDFANSVMNDGPFSSGEPSTSGSGSGLLDDFDVSIPSGIDQGKQGFVQAIGANARYGDATGEEIADFQIGNIGTMSFESEFDTLVAPYAPASNEDAIADEAMSALLNRIMALDSNQHCLMAEVPGIQSNDDFANCSP